MNSLLTQLHTRILEHLTDDPLRSPLGGVGIFHCRQPQHLRNIPIHLPTSVLVVSGRKVITLGERKIEISPGELLLLPSGCTIEIGNYPGHQGEEYLGLAMAFPEESITQFRRSYSTLIPAGSPLLWHTSAPKEMVIALAQWVDWCLKYPIDPTLTRHRQIELLLLLARTHVAGNLLLNQEASWCDRVAQRLTLDPAHDWSAGEVSRYLGIGESTLRRRLNEEQTNFRQILEESRMVAGLALLQETFWTVGQVAEAVGYSSHSRFSERFKLRFGLSPSDLKRSRKSLGKN
jgi:AraC-like DNA-binding protein